MKNWWLKKHKKVGQITIPVKPRLDLITLYDAATMTISWMIGNQTVGQSKLNQPITDVELKVIHELMEQNLNNTPEEECETIGK